MLHPSHTLASWQFSESAKKKWRVSNNWFNWKNEKENERLQSKTKAGEHEKWPIIVPKSNSLFLCVKKLCLKKLSEEAIVLATHSHLPSRRRHRCGWTFSSLVLYIFLTLVCRYFLWAPSLTVDGMCAVRSGATTGRSCSGSITLSRSPTFLTRTPKRTPRLGLRSRMTWDFSGRGWRRRWPKKDELEPPQKSNVEHVRLYFLHPKWWPAGADRGFCDLPILRVLLCSMFLSCR